MFDGNDVDADVDDDGAVAPDKAALLPGQTASFANVTSAASGINGVMIDLDGLPASSAAVGELSADDFVVRAGRSGDPAAWPLAPAPASVTVRPSAGTGGSDRITLTWPDRAIRNTWLQITIKANAHTGLTTPDVFYFGSLVGETGVDAPVGGVLRVGVFDYAAVRANLFRPSTITGRYDFDHSGRVGAADALAARAALFSTLPLLTASSDTSPAATTALNVRARVAAVAAFAPSSDRDEPTRLVSGLV